MKVSVFHLTCCCRICTGSAGVIIMFVICGEVAVDSSLGGRVVVGVAVVDSAGSASWLGGGVAGAAAGSGVVGAVSGGVSLRTSGREGLTGLEGSDEARKRLNIGVEALDVLALNSLRLGDMSSERLNEPAKASKCLTSCVTELQKPISLDIFKSLLILDLIITNQDIILKI